ncbi:MAG: hypothetical protein IRY89_00070 [Pseudolabrys sp.]|nr:hypothetical protein [Pseudolabrys sp.]
MIRFIFRLFGLLCLAAAFILVVYDGTKSIAGNALFLTSVRTLWQIVHAPSLAKLQPLITPYAAGYLWDPVTLAVLDAPASLLLTLFGIVLLLLGRRKKRLIGYERD